MKIFFLSPQNDLAALWLGDWILHATLQKLDEGLFWVVEATDTNMVHKVFTVPHNTLVYTTGMRPK